MSRFLSAFIVFIVFSPDISFSKPYSLSRELCSFDTSNDYLTYICSTENERNLFECKFSNLEYKSVTNIYFRNCNNISELSSESFFALKNNPELKEMYVNNVGLKTLNADVLKYFPRLEKLIASENQLNDIQCSNDNLEYLDLSFNQFTQIEPIKFYQIQTLILSNNKIGHIAIDAFSNFRRLEKLDLSFNELNELNVKLDLQELIIHHNKLKTLPEDIFSKTNVLYLDLSYNQLTNIESLKRTGAHELKVLNLTNNQIPFISDTTFVYFTKLEVLDLSFNNLTDLVDGIFDEQRKLLNLSLKNNNLLQMDFRILSTLMDLESLDFSMNHIKDINTIGEHLAVFRHLTRINMSNNEIIQINGFTNATFPALTYLNLRNNKFGCSHLKHFLKPFDLQKIRLDVDPSSKIKKGSSYRGVACQNDSSSFADDAGDDSILSSEQVANVNQIDHHSLQNLHEKINANNSLIIWMMIFIVVMISGFLFYINRDRMISELRRRHHVRAQRNPLNGYAEDHEPVISNTIIDTE